MNPLTNVKNITKLNETELASGSIHKKSWHDMYKESAWIFIGGLEYGLTEGDILAVFSQYGEIVNINLVRDKKTGKSKGFCFLCYANQKSTVLAVDNLNAIKLCNRTIRVDHVANYKPPKENDRDDEITKLLKSEGCAPRVIQRDEASEVSDAKTKKKKSKKEKKEKKKKKRKHKSDASDSEDQTSAAKEVKVKKEKHDAGYDKYDTSSNRILDSTNRKRNRDNSKGESSHFHENYRSKGDSHFKIEKDDGIHRSRLKIKTERDSDSDMHASSSKRHKRKISASSDEQTSNVYSKTKKHKDKRDEQKKNSNHKRIHKNAKDSSSSSSDDDDDSSSQSSSEDDDCEKQNQHSRKERMHDKRSFEEENRDRNYDRNKKPASLSSKSKHHDKAEKYLEYKSKTKYRNDDSDNGGHSRNSHRYKNKYHK